MYFRPGDGASHSINRMSQYLKVEVRQTMWIIVLPYCQYENALCVLSAGIARLKCIDVQFVKSDVRLCWTTDVVIVFSSLLSCLSVMFIGQQSWLLYHVREIAVVVAVRAFTAAPCVGEVIAGRSHVVRDVVVRLLSYLLARLCLEPADGRGAAE